MQRTYCDSLVWTEKEINIERNHPENAFWLEHVQRVKHFFDVGILPELVGNFFSRPTTMNPFPQVPSPPSDPTGEEVEAAYKYCYCYEDKEGEMIGCDNPQCHYEWFHFSCLKLSSKPKSTLWYCPDSANFLNLEEKHPRKQNYGHWRDKLSVHSC